MPVQREQGNLPWSVKVCVYVSRETRQLSGTSTFYSVGSN